MREMRAINFIAFCALVLFLDNHGVTEGHTIKKYLSKFKILAQLKNLRHGILPGTYWCGWGNIASNDSNVGLADELDTCCRTHDYCEDYINPKTTRYGLYNKSKLCRSSLCECELQFYDCLTRARGLYVSFVGWMFFKTCKQCFRTYYDLQECIDEGLDIRKETDRKGRRVFCAKFDQNPKWRQRFNTSPTSGEEFLTQPNDDARFVPESRFANDRNYYVDEDDVTNAIEDNSYEF